MLLLASASPRRLELLSSLGLTVVVRAPAIDESRLEGESPEALVRRLARAKAAAIRSGAGDVVVGADTVVVLGDRVLGKPVDDADARRMLRALSGRTHIVLGGYSVRRGEEERTGCVATEVSFRQLDAGEIDAYVASGEPRDKAGAYGIQGRGAALIDTVQGSFTNVVGLPLREVLAALRAFAPL